MVLFYIMLPETITSYEAYCFTSVFLLSSGEIYPMLDTDDEDEVDNLVNGLDTEFVSN